MGWPSTYTSSLRLLPSIGLHPRPRDMRDAGDGRERFVETAIEAVELVGLQARGLRIDLDDGAVRSVEAEVLMLELLQAENE